MCSYIECKCRRFFPQPKIADLAGTTAYEKVETHLTQRMFWHQIKSIDVLNCRPRGRKETLHL